MNYSIWTFAATLIVAWGENLLKNGDFEEEFTGEENWFCWGACSLVRSADAYEGQYSCLVADRAERHHSVCQWLEAPPGERYFASMMIKLMYIPEPKLWEEVTIVIQIQRNDGSQFSPRVGRIPFLRLDQGWQYMAGDFYIPEDATAVRFHVLVDDISVEYLVDNARVEAIDENINWREEADLRIDQIRKNDIGFNVQIAEALNPTDIVIEVAQTRSDFPFGCAVDARVMGGDDETSEKYNNMFFSFFEWAVIENHMKWMQMERVQYQIDFETADRALDVLESHGIPVRGHMLVWGKESKIQNWVLSMDGQQVREEVSRRITYAVEHFKDRVVHWDVNNEQLHGPFYEGRTGDPHYLDELFHLAHSLDPAVKLFLNDYQVVNLGHYTVAYADQAVSLMSRGVPVHGMGVQCHLDAVNNTPDPTLIQGRINRLGETGLPIWVTELDYEDPDVGRRAQVYEDILRLHYSMEEIEGVLLWGFWDQNHWKPDAALVDGEDFIINEAGQRVLGLLQGEWKTKATLHPTSASNEFQLRGFQGAYIASVYHNGELIKTQEFYVAPGTEDTSVDIEVGFGK